jgi:hypothetical protein
LAVALAGVALGLVCIAPKSARACSTAQPPAALLGYPANGEADVPTDVVPFYDTITARITDAATAKFVLTSSKGETIAVSAELSHTWHVDLVPVELLQPNTTYRIALSLPDEESVSGISFTTGAGPFQGVPEPPTASLHHYQFAADVPYNSCSRSPTGTCVALGTNLPVDVTHLWDGHEDGYAYLYERSSFTNLSGLDQGTPFDCVNLRSRAPNRVYSTAVQLCREDGPLFTLSSAEVTCTPEGLMQGAHRPERPSETEADPSGADETPGSPEDGPGNAEADGRGSSESSGCTFSAPSSRGAWHSLVLLLVAATLPLLRRARA